MEKIIHQQSAVKHKLLNCNTLLYYRYKPELVLGSANMILYWDRSNIIDKMEDHNRPDILLIVRENRTALVIDVAVLLTHNLTKIETKKIMNYENLALEIKKILWTLTLSHLSRRSSQQNFLNYLDNISLTKNILRVGQIAVLLQKCHIVHKFLGHAP